MPAYTLNRNEVMQDIFQLIKARKIIFPRWEDSEAYIDDIQNIQTDYNEELGKMKFINIGPDDFFHSILYAKISAQLLFSHNIL